MHFAWLYFAYNFSDGKLIYTYMLMSVDHSLEHESIIETLATSWHDNNPALRLFLEDG
jgi:hypothetical protein